MQGREEKFVHFKKQGQYSVGKGRAGLETILPFLFETNLLFSDIVQALPFVGAIRNIGFLIGGISKKRAFLKGRESGKGKRKAWLRIQN